MKHTYVQIQQWSHLSLTMDLLPFDIKELIASNLQGPDLASLSQVDPDFKGFFRNAVAPIFFQEFKRISKIIAPLKRLFGMQPHTHDVMEDGGDHHIMTYILGREVEEGELFEDDVEYHVWKTTQNCIDSGNYTNLNEIVNIYMMEVDASIQYQNEFLDEYFIENNLEDIVANM
mgnify:CR=1 FL=1